MGIINDCTREDAEFGISHSIPFLSVRLRHFERVGPGTSHDIDFVRLRVLYVSDKFMAVGNFFRYVTFPPEAAVHIACAFPWESPADPEGSGAHFTTILRNIVKSYSNAASSNIIFKNLVVDCTDQLLRIGMFDGIFEDSADTFRGRVRFDSTLRSLRPGLSLAVETYICRTYAPWFNILFRGIFSAGFPLDNITHAHLRSGISLEDTLQNPAITSRNGRSASFTLLH